LPGSTLHSYIWRWWWWRWWWWWWWWFYLNLPEWPLSAAVGVGSTRTYLNPPSLSRRFLNSIITPTRLRGSISERLPHWGEICHSIFLMYFYIKKHEYMCRPSLNCGFNVWQHDKGRFFLLCPLLRCLEGTLVW
jgi:hypothetical protein